MVPTHTKIFKTSSSIKKCGKSGESIRLSEGFKAPEGGRETRFQEIEKSPIQNGGPNTHTENFSTIAQLESV